MVIFVFAYSVAVTALSVGAYYLFGGPAAVLTAKAMIALLVLGTIGVQTGFFRWAYRRIRRKQKSEEAL